MKEELADIWQYVDKAFDGWIRPLLAFLWSGISYVIFPDKAYIPAACAVGGAMVLDILTKYYALRKPFGSITKAIKAGSISSDKFFRGTSKKIVSFAVIMILCGLSVRVSPVAGVAVFLSTLAYAVMFLREAQSCIENLVQAGHDDLGWLLPVLKKRQETILKNEGVTPTEKKEGDNNATI